MRELRQAAGLSRWRFAWIMARINFKYYFDRVFRPKQVKAAGDRIDAISDREAFEIAVQVLKRRS